MVTKTKDTDVQVSRGIVREKFKGTLTGLGTVIVLIASLAIGWTSGGLWLLFGGLALLLWWYLRG